MHGGGPSPSGSRRLHSYGFEAVSKAHTSASGRRPVIVHPNHNFVHIEQKKIQIIINILH